MPPGDPLVRLDTGQPVLKVILGGPDEVEDPPELRDPVLQEVLVVRNEDVLAEKNLDQ